MNQIPWFRDRHGSKRPVQCAARCWSQLHPRPSVHVQLRVGLSADRDADAAVHGFPGDSSLLCVAQVQAEQDARCAIQCVARRLFLAACACEEADRPERVLFQLRRTASVIRCQQLKLDPVRFSVVCSLEFDQLAHLWLARQNRVIMCGSTSAVGASTFRYAALVARAGDRTFLRLFLRAIVVARSSRVR
jgi:hypothetical protein